MYSFMMNNTALPPYFPYPRFLLSLALSNTSKLVYSLLLDRATLSQANGWTDNAGKLYLIFPICELAATIGKGTTTVKQALNELEKAGLIERRRYKFSLPNRIYMKLPDGRISDQKTVGKASLSGTEKRLNDGQKPDLMMGGKPSICGTEIRLSDGQETGSMMVGNLSTNNLTISNLNNNHLNRANETRTAYGRYKNVLLTDSELAELKMEIHNLPEYIESLSEYMDSTGKKYSGHAATIRRWAAKDKAKAASKGYDRDYSVGEDETV